jgi:hypothetical protein
VSAFGGRGGFRNISLYLYKVKPLKKLIPFLLVFIAACGAYNPGMVPYSHLFTATDSAYSFKERNMYLQTKNVNYQMRNPQIIDGRLLTELTPTVNFGKIGDKKDLIFFTRKKSHKDLQPVLDSAGNITNKVWINKGIISKIEYSDQNAKNRSLIYNDPPDLKRVLLIALIIIVGGALVIFLGLLGLVALANSLECYIATMVYGDRNAPEVVVLRKFRDEKLLPHFFGRVFVRMYYALSPTFVFIFKNNKPVNDLIRSILDKWVARLVKNDVEVSRVNN